MRSATAASEQREKNWILNIIGIIFFAGLAWWSYSRITRFETEGGFLSLPKPLKLLYELIGLWGVVGFWMLFVLYNVVSGIMKVIKENEKA